MVCGPPPRMLASWIAARRVQTPPAVAHTPFPGFASTASAVLLTEKVAAPEVPAKTKRDTSADARGRRKETFGTHRARLFPPIALGISSFPRPRLADRIYLNISAVNAQYLEKNTLPCGGSLGLFFPLPSPLIV